jgi:asparagine synthetase B (glutamine-hydrolysing)
VDVLPASRECVLWNFPFHPVEGVAIPPSPARDEREQNRRQGVWETLVRAIVREVDHSPVYVQFSGGCDSSLVLAAAVEACRRTDHTPPIPVTLRYPNLPETDESDYQDLVVGHLGLTEWRIHQEPDGFDLLAPAAIEGLRRFGLVWPAPPLAMLHFYRSHEPGLWLNGEGGDESLGPRRIGGLFNAWNAARRKQGRAVAGNLANTFAPQSVRERRIRIYDHVDLGWLSPDLQAEYLGVARRYWTWQPLRPSRYAERYLELPAVQLARHNIAAIGGLAGHKVCMPLMSPDVVHVVTDCSTSQDVRSRTRVLRRHATEHLPSEIVNRRDKRFMGPVFFNSATREFARRWDGRTSYVEIRASWLKEEWMKPEPSAMTMLLLQHAWLESEFGATPPTRSAAAGPESPGLPE